MWTCFRISNSTRKDRRSVRYDLCDSRYYCPRREDEVQLNLTFSIICFLYVHKPVWINYLSKNEYDFWFLFLIVSIANCSIGKEKLWNVLERWNESKWFDIWWHWREFEKVQESRKLWEIEKDTWQAETMRKKRWEQAENTSSVRWISFWILFGVL